MGIEQVLRRIELVSLADRVTEQIRSAIVLGQLAPGEKLTETVLATQLGVSRSPVREALSRLEVMGLVKSSTNYSACVWSPTEQDAEEIYCLKAALEIYACERALPNLTQEDFEQLEQEISKQESLIKLLDYVALVNSDRSFHELVVLRANSSRLLAFWDQLISQWEVLTMRRWRFDAERIMSRLLADHRAILEALKARDLPLLTQIHRRINAETCLETKELLRRQRERTPQAEIKSEAGAGQQP
jgi:DNA-binding GntR family transcriptional regulator